MPNSPAVASARGRLSAAMRHHPDDAAGLADRRQALAAAKIAQYVEDTLAAAPPLSDEQRNRLARLLRRPTETSTR